MVGVSTIQGQQIKKRGVKIIILIRKTKLSERSIYSNFLQKELHNDYLCIRYTTKYIVKKMNNNLILKILPSFLRIKLQRLLRVTSSGPKDKPAHTYNQEIHDNMNDTPSGDNASRKQSAGTTTFTPKDTVRETMCFIIDSLNHHYCFRQNLIDDQIELCLRNNTAGTWTGLTENEFHRMMVRLRLDGCDTWDSNVRHALFSLAAPFHPFRHFLNTLPRWDGKDRVREVIRRVSSEPLWEGFMRIWWRAMVAQWTGDKLVTSNQVAPILLSRKQGMRKSTFCRLLLPPELRDYFTDKFDLISQLRPENALYLYGLINMDEFDRYSAKQHTSLKNIMQLQSMHTSRSKKRIRTTLPRIASFIGTSNSLNILTDPSGPRRFFCCEVMQPIDCSTAMDYPQIYAQLLEEYHHGLPLHFCKEEEAAIQLHNRRYRVTSSLEESFLALYRPAKEDDQGATWLTATEIFQCLHRHFRGMLRNAGTVNQLGSTLSLLGVPHKRSNRGSLYRVVPLSKSGDNERRRLLPLHA